MAGGPSQLETFDPKPKLAEMDGQPMPESLTKGQQLAQLQGQKLICFGPQFPFREVRQEPDGDLRAVPAPRLGDRRHLPHPLDDDRAINHDPAHMFMNTGSQIAGRPSMGAWVTYGLGSEAEDLPGFVVLISTGKGGARRSRSPRGSGAAGFCRAGIRACSCAARAIRCFI